MLGGTLYGALKLDATRRVHGGREEGIVHESNALLAGRSVVLALFALDENALAKDERTWRTLDQLQASNEAVAVLLLIDRRHVFVPAHELGDRVAHRSHRHLADLALRGSHLRRGVLSRRAPQMAPRMAPLMAPRMAPRMWRLGVSVGGGHSAAVTAQPQPYHTR
eukprot:7380248-Prymnesium_polylepis.3